MDNAVIGNPNCLSSPLLFRQLFPVNPRRFGAKGPAFPRLAPCRLELQPPRTVCCGSESSPSSGWGGWEDLAMLDDSSSLGYVDSVRRFLASVGLHGKEQAFLFCMGFFSALAISRVRLPLMAVLPASAVLFLAGVSIGVAQGGASLADLLERSGRRRSPHRIESLVGFLDDLESKMAELKNGLEGAIKSNRLEMGEVKRYLGVVESVRSEVLPAKNFIMEYLLDGASIGEPAMIEGVELDKKPSQKGSSRKRKDVSVIGFDVLRYFRGLLQESLLSAETLKAKDSPKKEINVSEENAPNLIPTDLEESAKAGRIAIGWDLSPERVTGNNTQSMTEKSEVEKKSGISQDAAERQGEPSSSTGSMSNYNDEDDNLQLSKEYGYRDRSFKRSVFHYKAQREELDLIQNKYGKSSAREMDFKSKKTEELHAFSERESSMHSNMVFDRSFSHSSRNRHEGPVVGIGKNTGAPTQNKASEIESQHKNSAVINIASSSSAITADDEFHQSLEGAGDLLKQAKEYLKRESDEETIASSSSAITADDEFHQSLEEAGDLLKQAKEYLKRESDEETAEVILHRSAQLLSTAVALKPRSLLAVGQLGNTFLLHGELKLKTTRELRFMLSENDNSVIGRNNKSHSKTLVKPNLNKDDALSILVVTCEECEELLVDAGRMYKKALSIDNSDFRALYNWGLALSYRAQLIGDIGPEAAIDADKIYLAAIDKFAAMASRSNKYASDALFRWGLALQERSHLHPYDIRLKMKLLKQAKSMYEDVLRVDRNNPIVREALFSCISELNLNRQLK